MALARDHIVKLREERWKLAQEWLEEYSMHTSSAKLQGMGLGTLRAEYIHWYNRLLDHEKQAHSDFFINLSPQVEDELDFEEDEQPDAADRLDSTRDIRNTYSRILELLRNSPHVVFQSLYITVICFSI